MIESLAHLMDQLGAAWVLYVLIGMSVASVALVVERWLFFRARRVPVAQLEGTLLDALDKGPDHVRTLLSPYRGMAAQVPLSVVAHLHRGPDAVEELLASREASEQQHYERFLSWLSSIGANAPFVGLLGTVIGILGAFGRLRQTVGQNPGAGNQAIMGSISEALVATAVGLFVAIPAVMAYNYLRGQVKSAQADTRVLTGVLLAWCRQQHGGPAEAKGKSA
jgi:biopolymer transport protein ExbB